MELCLTGCRSVVFEKKVILEYLPFFMTHSTPPQATAHLLYGPSDRSHVWKEKPNKHTLWECIEWIHYPVAFIAICIRWIQLMQILYYSQQIQYILFLNACLVIQWCKICRSRTGSLMQGFDCGNPWWRRCTNKMPRKKKPLHHLRIEKPTHKITRKTASPHRHQGLPLHQRPKDPKSMLKKTTLHPTPSITGIASREPKQLLKLPPPPPPPPPPYLNVFRPPMKPACINGRWPLMTRGVEEACLAVNMGPLMPHL